MDPIVRIPFRRVVLRSKSQRNTPRGFAFEEPFPDDLQHATPRKGRSVGTKFQQVFPSRPGGSQAGFPSRG